MWMHRYQAESRLCIALGRSDKFTKLLRTNVDHRAVQLLENTREFLYAREIFRKISKVILICLVGFLQPMNLMTFSNDSTVRCFISKFIASESTHSAQTSPQMETIQLFTLQFYYCLVKDTMHALGIFVDLLMVCLSVRILLAKGETDFVEE